MFVITSIGKKMAQVFDIGGECHLIPLSLFEPNIISKLDNLVNDNVVFYRSVDLDSNCGFIYKKLEYDKNFFTNEAFFNKNSITTTYELFIRVTSSIRSIKNQSEHTGVEMLELSNGVYVVGEACGTNVTMLNLCNLMTVTIKKEELVEYKDKIILIKDNNIEILYEHGFDILPKVFIEPIVEYFCNDLSPFVFFASNLTIRTFSKLFFENIEKEVMNDARKEKKSFFKKILDRFKKI